MGWNKPAQAGIHQFVRAPLRITSNRTVHSMSFQFCCPQGHVLQGEPSQVGQLFQCPMCGSNFLIPPPTMDSAATGNPAPPGGFFQGPGTWPGGNAAGPAFPAQGPMPGMMPPQGMPMMPGGPMSAGSYPMPGFQPLAFAPGTVNSPVPGPPAAPAEPPPPPPPTAAEGETGRPRFDLGFDPGAKEALPFDIPGENEPEVAEPEVAPPEMAQSPAAPFSAAPLPGPSFSAPPLPAPSFPGATPPATTFPATSMPAPAFAPSAGGQDFLQSAPGHVGSGSATSEAAVPPSPSKVLHIRCPSGHVVKANSDLLGKNGRCPACKQTFELRYEDSMEFQRRTKKILHRGETKSGPSWIAWAFLAAFAVVAGLVALMLWLSH